MAFEGKYQKASFEYWLALISRKFYSTFSGYPELVFMIKMIISIFIAFLGFFLLRKFIGN